MNPRMRIPGRDSSATMEAPTSCTALIERQDNRICCASSIGIKWKPKGLLYCADDQVRLVQTELEHNVGITLHSAAELSQGQRCTSASEVLAECSRNSTQLHTSTPIFDLYEVRLWLILSVQ